MADIQDVFGGHEFDCAEVPPSEEFSILKAGWYNAVADEAEVKSSKAGDGYYIKIRFSILNEDPTLSNRKVWTNIMIEHPKAEVVAIGMKNLSAVGHAIGVMKIKDSSEILDKVLQIKLAIKDDPNYGPQNNVVAYKALEEQAVSTTPVASSPVAAETPVPAQAAAPAAANVPPWKK